jgi:hypothetical protein
MIWSYRVVRSVNKTGDVVYDIREAMYGGDEDDCDGMSIEQAEKLGVSITQDAIAAETSFKPGEAELEVEKQDALDELRDQLLDMLEALDMPIVDAKTVYSDQVLSASSKLRSELDHNCPGAVISVGISNDVLMVYWDKNKPGVALPDRFDGFTVIGRPIEPLRPAHD